MPGRFDDSLVSQIQQSNDIVDVISEHLSLKKKGREMVGVCPFHDDHRPSMYVNSAKQIFKCFACGAGGDVFKFVQMRENLTFPQAIERLAQRAGINLPSPKLASSASRPKPSADQLDPNTLAKVNAWAADYFQKNLYDRQKGKHACDYIAERKIKPENAKKWKLGLAVSQNDLLKAAKDKSIPMQTLAKAGLVVTQRQTGGFADKFVNRLMFAITDVTGRIIGFGGRTLDNADAKYINSPTTALFDKSNSLYGLEQARHQIVSTGTAVVVEGYTDCIMAHQFGCRNVVATLGTSFTTGHARILRRYAKKVVLIFDGDVAGTEAANRALEVCLSQRIDIKLASLPDGKDPCSFLLTAGTEEFEKLIENAVDVFQFKWDRLKTSFAADGTLAGNKAAIEEFLQTIAIGLYAGNIAAIDRGLIVNRLSRIIGLDTKDINTELNKRISQAARAANYDIQKSTAQPIDFGRGLFAAAQQEILEVLLNEPKLFETIRQKIKVEHFDTPILSQIAVLLFETLSTASVDADALLRAVLAKVESVEIGKAIVQLAQLGEKKGNFQARLTGALDAIQRHQAQMASRQLNTADDPERFLRRCAENTEKQNPHSVGMV